MQIRHELGPADDIARLCYSRVRYLPLLLRERLQREGLWQDLRQEVHLAAWEAWQKRLSEREIYRFTARRLYAFLKNCGYVAYRSGYYRPERPFSSISEDHDFVESMLTTKSNSAPGFVRPGDHLQETILATLRDNGGMSKRDLYTRLRISARELDWHCAPLLKLLADTQNPPGRDRLRAAT